MRHAVCLEIKTAQTVWVFSRRLSACLCSFRPLVRPETTTPSPGPWWGSHAAAQNLSAALLATARILP